MELDLADIKALFTAGSGVLAVLVTVVQISPIKVNPWSWLGKAVGRALNAEVLEQLKQTQNDLNEHIHTDDERTADAWRDRILQFNDELILGQPHTMERFDNVLGVIDKYQAYCKSHPEYPNNKSVHAIANILRVYDERMKKHDFL